MSSEKEAKSSIDLEKIEEAVKTIREVCRGIAYGYDCVKCPLGSNTGDCMIINTTPEKWKLQSDEKIPNKIFRD